jgi:4-hydroxy-tetrahydrodipicolinate synthase
MSQLDALPIWAAIHTPFVEKTLELDERALRHNARCYIERGLQGVFCNGLMGEVWALSFEERQRVVEILSNEAADQLGISVVISGASMEETVAHGVHAKRHGAAHVVLMVPTSGPRSEEQMLAYFRHVCSELDMPIVIFNSATAAGSPLPAHVFARLCEIPQVRLLKTTAYAQNEALRQAAHGGVLVSDPLEEHFLDNYIKYGQSILYADPEPYLYQMPGHQPIATYISQLRAGEMEKASATSRSLSPLRHVFNKWVMDPLIRGHMPNAALKRWCDLVGLRGGAVRAPLRALTREEQHELESDLCACAGFAIQNTPSPAI